MVIERPMCIALHRNRQPVDSNSIWSQWKKKKREKKTNKSQLEKEMKKIGPKTILNIKLKSN